MDSLPLKRLPLDPLVSELIDLLATQRSLVLVAAPGAGKTTRLPPALLRAPWLSGKVLLLQPRRVAARAAAHRIAAEQGWRVGQDVGYRIRFEQRVSSATRLEVLTEGILTRRMQADPLLDGVGAVVLDEFHERSLHSDLALALLKEVLRARDDLRLVVMSATLDPAAVATYLDGCAARTVTTTIHPLEVVYALRRREGPIEPAVAAAIRRALVEDPRQGDVLVFLPGVGEIRRVGAALGQPGHVEVLALHGSLPGPDQDRVLQRCESRRVILTTNVAETSVTVEGVTTVVDSGLARVPRFDPAKGIDHLELTRISRASADQRAGRAGRLGPGRVYRLWTAGEHASLAAQAKAEIRRVDLARVVLELRAWGADPETFDWFEAPDHGALQRAAQLLTQLGALEPLGGAITPAGRSLLAWPVHPRLARLLQVAHERGYPRAGATIAALLSERDILRTTDRTGSDLPTARSDVLLRMELLDLAEGARFRPSPQIWADIDMSAARHVTRVRDDLLRQAAARTGVARSAGPQAATPAANVEESALLALILAAYPDRVARRRQPNSPRGVMLGGRGVVLERRSVVRDDLLFVALWLEGSGRDARVRLASAVEQDWLRTREEDACCYDPARERVVAQRKLMLDDLCLSTRPCSPDPDRAARLLAEQAARDPLAALTPDDESLRFLSRLRWLHGAAPQLELPSGDPDWLGSLLPGLCLGKTSLTQLRSEPLLPWLRGALSASQLQTLEAQAPAQVRLPSGRSARLAYRDSGPPLLCAQLQELFGLADSPRVLRGEVEVLIDLLAPNRRPVQRTQDLRSFWNTTYAEVRKELRRRYPKHDWPEDPWSAPPTARPRRRR